MEVIPLAFCLLGVAYSVWQLYVVSYGTIARWVADLTRVQMNMYRETDMVFEYLVTDFSLPLTPGCIR